MRAKQVLARVRVTSFTGQELRVHAITHLHARVHVRCLALRAHMKNVSSLMRYAAMTAIDRIALNDGSNAMVYIFSDE
jgi:hypothetical protein